MQKLAVAVVACAYFLPGECVSFAQDTIKIGELNSYKSQPALLLKAEVREPVQIVGSDAIGWIVHWGDGEATNREIAQDEFSWMNQKMPFEGAGTLVAIYLRRYCR